MKSYLSSMNLVRAFSFSSMLTLILFSGCGSPPAEAGHSVLTVYQSSVSIGDPHIASGEPLS